VCEAIDALNTRPKIERHLRMTRFRLIKLDVTSLEQKRLFTSWIKSIFVNKLNHTKNMEVTKENFSDKLSLIESSIDDSIFVAIDGEFTGLNCQDDAISSLDTPAERYAKVQKTTTKFLLVQVAMI